MEIELNKIKLKFYGIQANQIELNKIKLNKSK